MRSGWLMVLALGSGWAAAEPVIWKCEDLQKLKEFSSIQCAPDAELYIPSRPNAGSISGGADFDRRYREFLNRHNIKGPAAPPSANAPAAGTPDSAPQGNPRESRSLDNFRSYSVPQR